MKIKELINKLLRKEELNALEIAELERFDPEAAGDGGEALRREFDKVTAERDSLKQAHSELLRRNRVGELAAASGCTEPDFLDFLAHRDGIDLADPVAAENFISGMAHRHPRCFRSALRPGVGEGTTVPAAAPAVAAAPVDRIGSIVDSLNLAPDAR